MIPGVLPPPVTVTNEPSLKIGVPPGTPILKNFVTNLGADTRTLYTPGATPRTRKVPSARLVAPTGELSRKLRTLIAAPISGWPVSLRVIVPVIVPAVSGRTRLMPLASPAVTSTRVPAFSTVSPSNTPQTNVFSVWALIK